MIYFFGAESIQFNSFFMSQSWNGPKRDNDPFCHP